jgi:hypothetical protein
VDGRAWIEAVHDFVDRIAAFHAESAPKRPSKQDVEGYERFRDEWFRRRGNPFAAPVRRGWLRR